MSDLKPPYEAHDLGEEHHEADEKVGDQGIPDEGASPSRVPRSSYSSPAMAEVRYISNSITMMRSAQAQMLSRLDDMTIEIGRLADCIHEISYGATIAREMHPPSPSSLTPSVSDTLATSSTGIRYSQNVQLFSTLILGLICHVRDVVEGRDRSSFQSGVGDRFNSLARVLSLLASLSEPQIHVPKVLKDKDLMSTFQRRAKGSVPMVDGTTVRTLRDYRSRSDVFRTLCDFVIALKLVPECLSPPGSEVVTLIEEPLIDEQGQLLLDTSTIVVRKSTPDETAFSKLNVNAYKHYITCRLKGMQPALSASKAVEMLLQEQRSRMKRDVGHKSRQSSSTSRFIDLGI